MGVSENRLNPCVPNGFADHYPYEKWLFHWEYTLFSDKPICFLVFFHGETDSPNQSLKKHMSYYDGGIYRCLP